MKLMHLKKSKRGDKKMEKIKMTTPLVEMDGDEMTRILWKMIKDELLLPFIDLKTEYYDFKKHNFNIVACCSGNYLCRCTEKRKEGGC